MVIFAKRDSPCSLFTTARETLSHAHRESTPLATPWGGHAHVCTPATDCASGHHLSRQQTTLGPSASPGYRPDSIPDLCLGKVIGAC